MQRDRKVSLSVAVASSLLDLWLFQDGSGTRLCCPQPQWTTQQTAWLIVATCPGIDMLLTVSMAVQ